jgi:hypothetical protein
LLTTAAPEPSWHVGFVEGLFGQPGEDGKPAGEVQVALLREDDLLHARLVLAAADYALANAAHMGNHPIYFRGILARVQGQHRLDRVSQVQIVPRQPLAQAS